jgi:hypothetical protein
MPDSIPQQLVVLSLGSEGSVLPLGELPAAIARRAA